MWKTDRVIHIVPAPCATEITPRKQKNYATETSPAGKQEKRDPQKQAASCSSVRVGEKQLNNCFIPTPPPSLAQLHEKEDPEADVSQSWADLRGSCMSRNLISAPSLCAKRTQGPPGMNMPHCGSTVTQRSLTQPRAHCGPILPQVECKVC